MKVLLFFIPSLAMALQILLGQPMPVQNYQEKFINNQSMKIIQGQHFTYYVKTQNGIVMSVNAKSPKMLAPVSDFIPNVSNCNKTLLVKIPLRMARYQYTCPNGIYIYQTFGVIGNLNTSAWIK